jgi:O-antigen ligase
MLDKTERYLLMLAVFLAPLRDFRPTEIAITFSDLVFCLVGLLLLVRRRLSIKPMQDITLLWMLAVLLLVGGLFASSIVNGAPEASLVVCTQYFFAYAFVPFLIIQDDSARALLLVKTFVFSSLFVVVCGFIFAATGYDGGQTFITGSGRLASFTGNPNNLASQISLTMPLLLYLWFSRALPSMLCLCIFACLVVGLIMTSSNGGLASTMLAIGCFLLFAGNFRWMVQGALVVVVAISAVITVGYDYLPDVFKRRVLQGLESGSIEQAGTYEDRVELIVEALEKLGGSLVLGIGADQYRETSYWKAPVHNQYLLVWVEGGTIAIIGWMLILTTIALIGLRAYQQPIGSRGAAIVLSMVTVFALIANTAPHLYARSWILPILLTMSVVLADRSRSHLHQWRPETAAPYRALTHRMPHHINR